MYIEEDATGQPRQIDLRDVYGLVPGPVVDGAVLGAVRHWLDHPRRDGGERRDSRRIGIAFKGDVVGDQDHSSKSA
jgi:hypothetical protein